MYEQHFGLRVKPFELRPDPDFMFFAERHVTALSMLEYGLFHHDGFSVITGEVGSGKTTVVRYLVNRLHSDVSIGLVLNTHKAFGSLMHWVLQAFGIEFQHLDGAGMYEAFISFVRNEYARGKRVVLIIDEAQNLEMQTLEELRLLSNVNGGDEQVLHTALVGQPELKRTLSAPELRQFRQRIASAFHLTPMTESETAGYISRRIEVAGGHSKLFSSDCADVVFKYSGGTPRLINVICDTSLVYAYAEQAKQVTPGIIRQVAEDRIESELLPVAVDPLQVSARV